jgi:hypothetical protein
VLSPLLAAAALLAPVHAQTITSAVPGFISYQGKVTNASGTAVGAGTPVNRTVIFRIWSHASNSTAADLVYSEQQTVTISEGEFSVLIGQGTAVSGILLGYSETSKGPPTVTFNNSFTLFGGAARYLGVTVDDGTGAADPEVSPRQQLVTNAYAFRARYAEGLGSNGNFSVAVTDQGNLGIGLPNPLFPVTTAPVLGDKIGLYGNFNYGLGIQFNNVQLHGATAADDITFGHGASAAMIETVRFKGNGNVGIGTANPTAKLEVNGTINVIDGGTKNFAAGLASEVGGSILNIGVNDSRMGTPQNNASQGGFLRFDARAGNNLFGLFARPAGGPAVAEIVSITAAGNVGIGTSPATKLDVNGGIRAAGASGYTFGGVGDTDGGLFSPADGTVTLWTNNSERLRVDPSGNVGIGTTSPNSRLNAVTAANTYGLTVGDSAREFGVYLSSGSDSVQIGSRSNHPVQFFTNNGSPAMTLATTGNFGVGTATPSAKLHVAGGIKVDGANVIELGAGVAGKEGAAGHIGYTTYSAGAGSQALDIVGAGQVGVNRFVRIWDRLGIGTSSPIAPLHVASSNNVPAYQRLGYMYQHGASAADDNNVVGPYGLVVDSYIRTPEVDISSDARIKTVIGRSSSANDLDVLQKIEVTDYQFRDQVGRGSRVMKKVIAQQVEQIYPTAVRQTTDIVPDIMAKAGVNDGWVQLATTLKAGERVRLLIGNNWEMTEVLEAELGRFRVNLPSSTNEVYVYGREVSDFRVIDYDAIAMLNVSATQELKRQHDTEVASLRTANEALIARVAELEAKDRARDAKLAAIEKLLTSSSTVMAQPAKPATANGQE